MDWSTIVLVLGGGVLVLGACYLLLILTVMIVARKEQKRIFDEFDRKKRDRNG